MGRKAKVLTGILVGVGAVALAPFTGGGSVIAAGVSLAGSLAGARTIATAVGLGAAGGIIGDIVADSEEAEEKRKIDAAHQNGFDKGVLEYKKKFSKILEDVKLRNDFLLANIALGIVVAKCDGVISAEEKNELNFVVGEIYKNPTYSQNLKDNVHITVQSIMKDNWGLKDIIIYLEPLNEECLVTLNELVEIIILADGIEHEKEKSLRDEWQHYLNERGVLIG